MSKYWDEEPMVVQLARETISMQNEIIRLRDEVEELREYKDKYMNLLNDSIAHSGQMIGGMLQLAMVPGVLDACARNNAETASI